MLSLGDIRILHYHSLIPECMDEVQALLMVGLVFTVGFAGYLMLDSQQGIEQLEIEQDPHWPILDVCFCLLYTSPSPRDGLLSRMPSSA